MACSTLATPPPTPLCCTNLLMPTLLFGSENCMWIWYPPLPCTEFLFSSFQTCFSQKRQNTLNKLHSKHSNYWIVSYSVAFHQKSTFWCGISDDLATAAVDDDCCEVLSPAAVVVDDDDDGLAGLTVPSAANCKEKDKTIFRLYLKLLYVTLL